jgi:hypothetical protein
MELRQVRPSRDVCRQPWRAADATAPPASPLPGRALKFFTARARRFARKRLAGRLHGGVTLSAPDMGPQPTPREAGKAAFQRGDFTAAVRAPPRGQTRRSRRPERPVLSRRLAPAAGRVGVRAARVRLRGTHGSARRHFCAALRCLACFADHVSRFAPLNHA